MHGKTLNKNRQSVYPRQKKLKLIHHRKLARYQFWILASVHLRRCIFPKLYSIGGPGTAGKVCGGSRFFSKSHFQKPVWFYVNSHKIKYGNENSYYHRRFRQHGTGRCKKIPE